MLAPRPAEFFTGGRRPTGHYIRYSSPAEEQIASQLQNLLRSAGSFPPFALTPVRLQTERSISVFLAEPVSLTVESEPGEDVQIWYRGDREAARAPIVYTGKIGPEGSVVVSVPRAYLMVGKPERQSGIPLNLQREQGSARTVLLPPKAAKRS